MKDLLKKTIEAVGFPQSNVDMVLEEIELVAAMGALLDLFTVVPFKLALSSDRSSHQSSFVRSGLEAIAGNLSPLSQERSR